MKIALISCNTHIPSKKHSLVVLVFFRANNLHLHFLLYRQKHCLPLQAVFCVLFTSAKCMSAITVNTLLCCAYIYILPYILKVSKPFNACYQIAYHASGVVFYLKSIPSPPVDLVYQLPPAAYHGLHYHHVYNIHSQLNIADDIQLGSGQCMRTRALSVCTDTLHFSTHTTIYYNNYPKPHHILLYTTTSQVR